MYPTTSSPGFYPADEIIAAQTSRNREAVLRLAETADCMYRVIGKETQYCGLPSATVYTDDFEAARGWMASTTGATAGRFERGDPAATNSSGAKQLGTTVSGLNDLVTGRLAGASAGEHDIDGGVTSIASPSITLPAGSNLHAERSPTTWRTARNSSSADYLRVKVNGTTVLQELGAADDDDAVWATASVNLSAYAGQSVQIVVEAADLSTASLVEAAVDDVRITQG